MFKRNAKVATRDDQLSLFDFARTRDREDLSHAIRANGRTQLSGVPSENGARMGGNEHLVKGCARRRRQLLARGRPSAVQLDSVPRRPVQASVDASPKEPYHRGRARIPRSEDMAAHTDARAGSAILAWPRDDHFAVAARASPSRRGPRTPRMRGDGDALRRRRRDDGDASSRPGLPPSA